MYTWFEKCRYDRKLNLVIMFYSIVFSYASPDSRVPKVVRVASCEMAPTLSSPRPCGRPGWRQSYYLFLWARLGTHCCFKEDLSRTNRHFSLNQQQFVSIVLKNLLLNEYYGMVAVHTVIAKLIPHFSLAQRIHFYLLFNQRRFPPKYSSFCFQRSTCEKNLTCLPYYL